MNESRSTDAEPDQAGSPPPIRVRIVGAGRAGRSFERALVELGWHVEVVGRDVDPAALASGVDLVLLCVPDGQIAAVAASIDPVEGTVVAHCAGSLGLDVLDPHPDRATLHPLVSLPSAELGAARLRGAWFGVSGHPVAGRVVDALGGRSVEVSDEDRATYHAAAVVASNHLVALLGQVERIAADVGVPLEAFLALASGSLDNVGTLGPAAALTGPVARGDWATVRRHLDAIDPGERAAYLEMVRAAAALAGRDVPPLDR